MAREICVTLGDPSGISFEVLFKWLLALENHTETLEEKIVIHGALLNGDLKIKAFASVDILALLLKRYQLPLNFEGGWLKTKKGVSLELMDVPYDNISKFQLGKVIEESALNSYKTLESASNYIKDHQKSSLVTLPINKEGIMNIHPSFVGHTEYLQAFFEVKKVMMCFFSPVFNLSLMTTHIPVADLSKTFRDETFIDESLSMAYDFHQFIASEKPLLILGLNPHAGEHGKIGDEEILFSKLIKKHQDRGENMVGPFSADSAFVDVLAKKYDHVLAAYHDQGLIPLKMLSKGKSVNFTYGLPFIRTSVDHGTAYDIAGTLKADPSSFHYAFLKAYDLM